MSDKPTWRTVAIPFPDKRGQKKKRLAKFAEEVEYRLNDLTNEGYALAGGPIEIDDNGLVLLWHLRPERLQLPAPTPGGHLPMAVPTPEIVGEYSMALFQKVLQATQECAEDEEQETVQKCVDETLAKAGLEDIDAAVTSCQNILKRHKTIPHSEEEQDNCFFERVVSILIEVLEKKSRFATN